VGSWPHSLVGGGASHDYQRWFNLADVALLNGTGRASAIYFEPQDLTVETVRGADVLLISANKAFPDPAVRKEIAAHADAGKGLVLLHPGLWYNWPDWPEFNRTLAGGGSRGHDSLGEFEVLVTGGDHPLARQVLITDNPIGSSPCPGTVKSARHPQSKQKAGHSPGLVVSIPRPDAITLGHDGRAHSRSLPGPEERRVLGRRK
jgi:hypothetical protein